MGFFHWVRRKEIVFVWLKSFTGLQLSSRSCNKLMSFLFSSKMYLLRFCFEFSRSFNGSKSYKSSGSSTLLLDLGDASKGAASMVHLFLFLSRSITSHNITLLDSHITFPLLLFLSRSITFHLFLFLSWSITFFITFSALSSPLHSLPPCSHDGPHITAFTHFLKVCQKNPLHDCVKPRGGGVQGPFTQCVKKHPFW